MELASQSSFLIVIVDRLFQFGITSGLSRGEDKSIRSEVWCLRPSK